MTPLILLKAAVGQPRKQLRIRPEEHWAQRTLLTGMIAKDPPSATAPAAANSQV
jgi:hypothetical protein